MNVWFDEKSEQVDVSRMKAFGIEISSRYGRARELVEMLQFSESCARAGLNRFVKEIFYDSKADICSFVLLSTVEQYSEDEQKLLAIARDHISQFDWFGYIEHGREM